VKNVSITHLDRTADGGWQVRLFNDVSHLEESDVPVTQHQGDARARPQT
jgi:hypothetical protein